MKNLYIFLLMLSLSAYTLNAQVNCTAGFGKQADPSSTLRYNFWHQSSISNLPAGNYYNAVTFNFGDGTSFQDSIPVGWSPQFSHVYSSPGVYPLQLQQQVVDSNSANVLCTSYAYDTIVIASAVSCNAHYTVTFPASGSLAATFHNNSLNNQSPNYYRIYSWDFGDGNVSSLLNPTHTYAAMGNYQVSLIAYAIDVNGIDTLCSDYYTRMIHAGGVDTCEAYFSSSVDPATIEVNFKAYNYVYSVAGAQTITDYTWDFGDGNTATGRSVKHTYTQFGTYNVRLISESRDSLTQAFVCADTILRIVYVGYPSPRCNAQFAIDSNNFTPNNFNIYNLSTPASNHPVYSVFYHWDFGDSSTSNLPFPLHTYANNGPYTLCLTITATDSLNRSCSDVYCRQIGIDSIGNLIYKNSGGFTLNVLDPQASVGEEEFELNRLVIYPNPASTEVTIGGLEDLSDWYLYDLQGRLITEGKVDISEPSIALKNKFPGLYILHIKNRRGMKSIKLQIK